MGRVFTKYNENHKGMIEMTVSQLCGCSLRRSLVSQITEYIWLRYAPHKLPRRRSSYTHRTLLEIVYTKKE